MLSESICAFVLFWQTPEKYELLNPVNNRNIYAFNHVDGRSPASDAGYGMASSEPSNCYLSYCKGSASDRSWSHISDIRNSASSCIANPRGVNKASWANNAEDPQKREPDLYELSVSDSRLEKSNTSLYALSPKGKMLILGDAIPETYIYSDLIKKPEDNLTHWTVADFDTGNKSGGSIYSTDNGWFLKKSLENLAKSVSSTGFGNVTTGFANENGAVFVSSSGSGSVTDLETSRTCSQPLTLINYINPTKKDLVSAMCQLLNLAPSCPGLDDKLTTSLLINMYQVWPSDINVLNTNCKE